jgi:hypothetical protein
MSNFKSAEVPWITVNLSGMDDRLMRCGFCRLRNVQCEGFPDYAEIGADDGSFIWGSLLMDVLGWSDRGRHSIMFFDG